MSKDTAIFWLSVTILITFGLIVGQIAAVMVVAMVAAVLAYAQAEPESFSGSSFLKQGIRQGRQSSEA